ncbi:MAG: hypothetical protein HQL22_08680, partial [Candidatus Omnitrophica bacterium]|nr:hypothetical protein [Candidatus Omnitrophota bacterium]
LIVLDRETGSCVLAGWDDLRSIYRLAKATDAGYYYMFALARAAGATPQVASRRALALATAIHREYNRAVFLGFWRPLDRMPREIIPFLNHIKCPLPVVPAMLPGDVLDVKGKVRELLAREEFSLAMDLILANEKILPGAFELKKKAVFGLARRLNADGNTAGAQALIRQHFNSSQRKGDEFKKIDAELQAPAVGDAKVPEWIAPAKQAELVRLARKAAGSPVREGVSEIMGMIDGSSAGVKEQVWLEIANMFTVSPQVSPDKEFPPTWNALMKLIVPSEEKSSELPLKFSLSGINALAPRDHNVVLKELILPLVAPAVLKIYTRDFSVPLEISRREYYFLMQVHRAVIRLSLDTGRDQAACVAALQASFANILKSTLMTLPNLNVTTCHRPSMAPVAALSRLHLRPTLSPEDLAGHLGPDAVYRIDLLPLPDGFSVIQVRLKETARFMNPAEETQVVELYPYDPTASGALPLDVLRTLVNDWPATLAMFRGRQEWQPESWGVRSGRPVAFYGANLEWRVASLEALRSMVDDMLPDVSADERAAIVARNWEAAQLTGERRNICTDTLQAPAVDRLYDAANLAYYWLTEKKDMPGREKIAAALMRIMMDPEYADGRISWSNACAWARRPGATVEALAAYGEQMPEEYFHDIKEIASWIIGYVDMSLQNKDPVNLNCPWAFWVDWDADIKDKTREPADPAEIRLRRELWARALPIISRTRLNLPSTASLCRGDDKEAAEALTRAIVDVVAQTPKAVDLRDPLNLLALVKSGYRPIISSDDLTALLETGEAFKGLQVADTGGQPALVLEFARERGWSIVHEDSGAADGKIYIYLREGDRPVVEQAVYERLSAEVNSAGNFKPLIEVIRRGKTLVALTHMLADIDRFFDAMYGLRKPKDKDDAFYIKTLTSNWQGRGLRPFTAYVPKYNLFRTEQQRRQERLLTIDADAGALFDVAKPYARKGEYDRALEVLDQALEQVTGYSAVWEEKIRDWQVDIRETQKAQALELQRVGVILEARFHEIYTSWLFVPNYGMVARVLRGERDIKGMFRALAMSHEIRRIINEEGIPEDLPLVRLSLNGDGEQVLSVRQAFDRLEALVIHTVTGERARRAALHASKQASKDIAGFEREPQPSTGLTAALTAEQLARQQAKQERYRERKEQEQAAFKAERQKRQARRDAGRSGECHPLWSAAMLAAAGNERFSPDVRHGFTELADDLKYLEKWLITNRATGPPQMIRVEGVGEVDSRFVISWRDAQGVRHDNLADEGIFRILDDRRRAANVIAHRDIHESSPTEKEGVAAQVELFEVQRQLLSQAADAADFWSREAGYHVDTIRQAKTSEHALVLEAMNAVAVKILDHRRMTGMRPSVPQTVLDVYWRHYHASAADSRFRGEVLGHAVQLDPSRAASRAVLIELLGQVPSPILTLGQLLVKMVRWIDDFAVEEFSLLSRRMLTFIETNKSGKAVRDALLLVRLWSKKTAFAAVINNADWKAVLGTLSHDPDNSISSQARDLLGKISEPEDWIILDDEEAIADPRHCLTAEEMDVLGTQINAAGSPQCLYEKYFQRNVRMIFVNFSYVNEETVFPRIQKELLDLAREEYPLTHLALPYPYSWNRKLARVLSDTSPEWDDLTSRVGMPSDFRPFLQALIDAGITVFCYGDDTGLAGDLKRDREIVHVYEPFEKVSSRPTRMIVFAPLDPASLFSRHDLREYQQPGTFFSLAKEFILRFDRKIGGIRCVLEQSTQCWEHGSANGQHNLDTFQQNTPVRFDWAMPLDATPLGKIRFWEEAEEALAPAENMTGRAYDGYVYRFYRASDPGDPRQDVVEPPDDGLHERPVSVPPHAVYMAPAMMKALKARYDDYNSRRFEQGIIWKLAGWLMARFLSMVWAGFYEEYLIFSGRLDAADFVFAHEPASRPYIGRLRRFLDFFRYLSWAGYLPAAVLHNGNNVLLEMNKAARYATRQALELYFHPAMLAGLSRDEQVKPLAWMESVFLVYHELLSPQGRAVLQQVQELKNLAGQSRASAHDLKKAAALVAQMPDPRLPDIYGAWTDWFDVPGSATDLKINGGRSRAFGEGCVRPCQFCGRGNSVSLEYYDPLPVVAARLRAFDGFFSGWHGNDVLRWCDPVFGVRVEDLYRALSQRDRQAMKADVTTRGFSPEDSRVIVSASEIARLSTIYRSAESQLFLSFHLGLPESDFDIIRALRESPCRRIDRDHPLINAYARRLAANLQVFRGSAYFMIYVYRLPGESRFGSPTEKALARGLELFGMDARQITELIAGQDRPRQVRCGSWVFDIGFMCLTVDGCGAQFFNDLGAAAGFMAAGPRNAPVLGESPERRQIHRDRPLAYPMIERTAGGMVRVLGTTGETLLRAPLDALDPLTVPVLDTYDWQRSSLDVLVRGMKAGPLAFSDEPSGAGTQLLFLVDRLVQQAARGAGEHLGVEVTARLFGSACYLEPDTKFFEDHDVDILLTGFPGLSDETVFLAFQHGLDKAIKATLGQDRIISAVKNVGMVVRISGQRIKLHITSTESLDVFSRHLSAFLNPEFFPASATPVMARQSAQAMVRIAFYLTADNIIWQRMSREFGRADTNDDIGRFIDDYKVRVWALLCLPEEKRLARITERLRQGTAAPPALIPSEVNRKMLEVAWRSGGEAAMRQVCYSIAAGEETAWFIESRYGLFGSSASRARAFALAHRDDNGLPAVLQFDRGRVSIRRLRQFEILAVQAELERRSLAWQGAAAVDGHGAYSWSSLMQGPLIVEPEASSTAADILLTAAAAANDDAHREPANASAHYAREVQYLDLVMAQAPSDSVRLKLATALCHAGLPDSALSCAQPLLKLSTIGDLAQDRAFAVMMGDTYRCRAMVLAWPLLREKMTAGDPNILAEYERVLGLSDEARHWYWRNEAAYRRMVSIQRDASSVQMGRTFSEHAMLERQTVDVLLHAANVPGQRIRQYEVLAVAAGVRGFDAAVRALKIAGDSQLDQGRYGNIYSKALRSLWLAMTSAAAKPLDAGEHRALVPDMIRFDKAVSLLNGQAPADAVSMMEQVIDLRRHMQAERIEAATLPVCADDAVKKVTEQGVPVAVFDAETRRDRRYGLEEVARFAGEDRLRVEKVLRECQALEEWFTALGREAVGERVGRTLVTVEEQQGMFVSKAGGLNGCGQDVREALLLELTRIRKGSEHAPGYLPLLKGVLADLAIVSRDVNGRLSAFDIEMKQLYSRLVKLNGEPALEWLDEVARQVKRLIDRFEQCILSAGSPEWRSAQAVEEVRLRFEELSGAVAPFLNQELRIKTIRTQLAGIKAGVAAFAAAPGGIVFAADHARWLALRDELISEFRGLQALSLELGQGLEARAAALLNEVTAAGENVQAVSQLAQMTYMSCVALSGYARELQARQVGDSSAATVYHDMLRRVTEWARLVRQVSSAVSTDELARGIAALRASMFTEDKFLDRIHFYRRAFSWYVADQLYTVRGIVEALGSWITDDLAPMNQKVKHAVGVEVRSIQQIIERLVNRWQSDVIRPVASAEQDFIVGHLQEMSRIVQRIVIAERDSAGQAMRALFAALKPSMASFMNADDGVHFMPVTDPYGFPTSMEAVVSASADYHDRAARQNDVMRAKSDRLRAVLNEHKELLDRKVNARFERFRSFRGCGAPVPVQRLMVALNRMFMYIWYGYAFSFPPFKVSGEELFQAVYDEGVRDTERFGAKDAAAFISLFSFDPDYTEFVADPAARLRADAALVLPRLLTQVREVRRAAAVPPAGGLRIVESMTARDYLALEMIMFRLKEPHLQRFPFLELCLHQAPEDLKNVIRTLVSLEGDPHRAKPGQQLPVDPEAKELAIQAEIAGNIPLLKTEQEYLHGVIAVAGHMAGDERVAAALQELFHMDTRAPPSGSTLPNLFAVVRGQRLDIDRSLLVDREECLITMLHEASRLAYPQRTDEENEAYAVSFTAMAIMKIFCREIGEDLQTASKILEDGDQTVPASEQTVAEARERELERSLVRQYVRSSNTLIYAAALRALAAFRLWQGMPADQQRHVADELFGVLCMTGKTALGQENRRQSMDTEIYLSILNSVAHEMVLAMSAIARSQGKSVDDYERILPRIKARFQLYRHLLIGKETDLRQYFLRRLSALTDGAFASQARIPVVEDAPLDTALQVLDTDVLALLSRFAEVPGVGNLALRLICTDIRVSRPALASLHAARWLTNVLGGMEKPVEILAFGVNFYALHQTETSDNEGLVTADPYQFKATADLLVKLPFSNKGRMPWGIFPVLVNAQWTPAPGAVHWKERLNSFHHTCMLDYLRSAGLRVPSILNINLLPSLMVEDLPYIQRYMGFFYLNIAWDQGEYKGPHKGGNADIKDRRIALIREKNAEPVTWEAILARNRHRYTFHQLLEMIKAGKVSAPAMLPGWPRIVVHLLASRTLWLAAALWGGYHAYQLGFGILFSLLTAAVHPLVMILAAAVIIHYFAMKEEKLRGMFLLSAEQFTDAHGYKKGGPAYEDLMAFAVRTDPRIMRSFDARVIEHFNHNWEWFWHGKGSLAVLSKLPSLPRIPFAGPRYLSQFHIHVLTLLAVTLGALLAYRRIFGADGIPGPIVMLAAFEAVILGILRFGPARYTFSRMFVRDGNKPRLIFGGALLALIVWLVHALTSAVPGMTGVALAAVPLVVLRSNQGNVFGMGRRRFLQLLGLSGAAVCGADKLSFCGIALAGNQIDAFVSPAAKAAQNFLAGGINSSWQKMSYSAGCVSAMIQAGANRQFPTLELADLAVENDVMACLQFSLESAQGKARPIPTAADMASLRRVFFNDSDSRVEMERYISLRASRTLRQHPFFKAFIDDPSLAEFARVQYPALQGSEGVAALEDRFIALAADTHTLERFRFTVDRAISQLTMVDHHWASQALERVEQEGAGFLANDPGYKVRSELWQAHTRMIHARYSADARSVYEKAGQSFLRRLALERRQSVDADDRQNTALADLGSWEWARG